MRPPSNYLGTRWLLCPLADESEASLCPPSSAYWSRGGHWLCWGWGSLWVRCVFCIQPLDPGLNLQSSPFLSFNQMEGIVSHLLRVLVDLWKCTLTKLHSLLSLVIVRCSLDEHVGRFKFHFLGWPHLFLKSLFCTALFLFRLERKAIHVGVEKLHIQSLW